MLPARVCTVPVKIENAAINLGANHGGGFAKNHSLSPKNLLSLECLHHEVQKTKKKDIELKFNRLSKLTGVAHLLQLFVTK